MAKTKDKDPIAEARRAAKKKTHLIVLIDESGSMQPLVESVVTGVNKLLATFREGDAKTRVTLGLFDEHPGADRIRYPAKAAKLKGVEDWAAADYNPRGMTPLNDAILDAVTLGLAEAKDDESVFLAVITDGMENASEASRDTVRAALVDAETKHHWGIVYLGANQDAQAVAAAYGLRGKGQAYTFMATPSSVGQTMATVSAHAGARAAAGPGAQGAAAYEASSSSLYDQTGGTLTGDAPEDEPEDKAEPEQ